MAKSNSPILDYLSGVAEKHAWLQFVALIPGALLVLQGCYGLYTLKAWFSLAAWVFWSPLLIYVLFAVLIILPLSVLDLLIVFVRDTVIPYLRTKVGQFPVTVTIQLAYRSKAAKEDDTK